MPRFKTFSAPLVPTVGVFNVRRGRRANDRRLHLGRVRICRRTSSQGMPSGPERSRSSNRRSNSSRCAAVRGTAPGDSLRLSHSSSINRNRSSELRLSMFSAGLLVVQICHFCGLSATPATVSMANAQDERRVFRVRSILLLADSKAGRAHSWQSQAHEARRRIKNRSISCQDLVRRDFPREERSQELKV